MEGFKEKNGAFLETYGLKSCDLGAHSYRKGASTYVTLGITHGPSVIAMYNRVGWDTGKVLGTYLQ